MLKEISQKGKKYEDQVVGVDLTRVSPVYHRNRSEKPIRYPEKPSLFIFLTGPIKREALKYCIRKVNSGKRESDGHVSNVS